MDSPFNDIKKVLVIHTDQLELKKGVEVAVRAFKKHCGFHNVLELALRNDEQNLHAKYSVRQIAAKTSS